jgi:predicted DNA-binding transcriptional regulator AlpA
MTKQSIAEIREQDFWRYSDLERLGIVQDRATLRRWMKADDDPFPAGKVLSANSVAWVADEVRVWLDRRPRGPAPQPRHIETERSAREATEFMTGRTTKPGRSAPKTPLILSRLSDRDAPRGHSLAGASQSVPQERCSGHAMTKPSGKPRERPRISLRGHSDRT